jgi:hypothetical protein
MCDFSTMRKVKEGKVSIRSTTSCSLLAASDFYYCFLLVHKISTGVTPNSALLWQTSVDWLEYPVSKPVIVLEPLQQVARITMVLKSN